ncbi:MAG TPA: DNA polymerase III subunit delta [Phycisphaerae bacterium]|nr:DNA polymerase III subunit delta [Phycisphaerae bacterium]
MVAADSASAARQRVFVLHGKDDYLQRMHLQQVVRRVVGDDDQHMALTQFDGPEAALADVLDELRTLPLLAERRVVIVRQADPFIKNHRAALEQYLAAPSPTGVLVLLCDSWPSNTRLARRVPQVGEAIECETPPRRRLASWLVNYAAQHCQKKLQPPTAQKLVDLIGDDSLGKLCGEIDKLATYVGDAVQITDNDVEELVGHHRQEKVFGIIDAAERRDLAQAMELWQQVLASDRDAPYRAIGGLAWALRRLIDQQPHPSRAAGRRLDPAQLMEHLVRLAEADHAIKTGTGTVQSVVEKFIVELCTR